MNHLKTFNFSYEQLEILKILAKFPNDVDSAFELIRAGMDDNDFEFYRVISILNQFIIDGIWSYKKAEDGMSHSIFKIDIKDFILNFPNPIPEKIRSGIDTSSIIEKLHSSNLDLTEINYITLLLKRDAVSQF